MSKGVDLSEALHPDVGAGAKTERTDLKST